MIKISTRLVILFNDFVIKIPISRRGYLQCINEQVIWEKYKGVAPLAELKWMKFGVVCQKRYNPINNIDFDEVIKIKSIITEFNFDNCDLWNYKNWGINDGKIYLLDYGINEYISTLY